MVSRQPPLHHSQQTQLRQRNSRLFIFLLIGFCLFFFMRYTSRLIEYGQEQLAVSQWEQKITDAKLEQAQLLAHRDYVQTDAYVEEVSRQELLMARPGDTLLVILPDKRVPSEGQSGDDTLNSENAESNPTAAGNANTLIHTVPSPVEAGTVFNSTLTDGVQLLDTDVSTSAGPASSVQKEPVWRQWILLFSQAP